VVAGRELARRRFLPAQLGQLTEQFLLLGVEPGRGLHGHVDDQVAAARAVQVLHAVVVERDDLAGLGAGADVDVGRPVQALHVEGGPEGGRYHGDRDRAVQVVALALEDRVRPLGDLQEQVAGRAAARADLALPGQLDVGAVLDAGRDADLDRAPGADPAVAVALRAGPGQQRAVATAAGAGPGGHDLAQERPGDLADLAPAATHVAGLRVGAGRGALAGTGRADHGGVHGQFAGGAERALGQVQLDPDGGVAATPGPAARAAGGAPGPGAEERVHDVAEREPGPEPAGRPGRARVGPGERVGAHVVHLALLRVGEDLVGLGDLLEPLLGLRIRVDVGVQFAGEPPVRPLDLLRRRVTPDPEDGVILGRH
jgi:hypothetical protein